ncbi:MAG TPA: YncE family protein, partial [Patescibacteria group bacterium]
MFFQRKNKEKKETPQSYPAFKDGGIDSATQEPVAFKLFVEKNKLKLSSVCSKAKIFFVDHLNILFRSAAENHLRLQSIKQASEEDGSTLEFQSYSHLKRYQKKARILTASLSSTMASVLIAIIIVQAIFPGNNSKGANYTFTQASWVGGATSNTATHPVPPSNTDNRTGWTQYSAKDATVAAGASVQLAAQSGTITQTTDAGVGDIPNSGGFNAGTKSNTFVNGTGAAASVGLNLNITEGTKINYAVGTQPFADAYDSTTNSVWVTNYSGNTVSKVNISNGTKTDYSTGTSPLGIAFDGVTNSVWVANNGANTVSKINVTNGTKVDYAAGSQPFGVVFDNVTNSIWVTNYSGGTSGSVSKFNINDGTRVDYAVQNGPYGITFDSTSNSVWVANFSAYTVSKVNIFNGSRVDYAGGQQPYGIAYDSVTNSVWISSWSGASIIKMNASNGTTVSYATGSHPDFGLIFDNITNSIWVSSFDNGTVTKVNINNGSQTVYSTGGTNTYGLALDRTTNSIWAVNQGTTNVTKLSLTKYATPGTFTSAAIDTGQKANFTTLSFSSSVPTGTNLSIDVRAGNTAVPDLTWTAWQTSIASGGNISGLAGNRYVQYRANLSATNTTLTPQLNDITINYNYYPANKSLTSSWYDSSSPENAFTKIGWNEDINMPAGTNVWVQIQTAPMNGTAPGTPTGFVGPDGTSGSYFSSAYSGCNKNALTGAVSCSLSSSISVGDGLNDEWMQYKIFLNSDGQNNPTVSQVQMIYVVNAAPSVSAVNSSVQDSDGILKFNYTVSDPEQSNVNISYGADVGVTLGSAIDSNVQTITLGGNSSSFPSSSQTIQIDQEQITCTGRVGSTLNVCTRGDNTTRKASHSQGTAVWFVATPSKTTGGGTNVNVSPAGNTYSGTWTIKDDLSGIFLNNTARLRVIANDMQAANQVSPETGATATFTLDTTNPAAPSAYIDHPKGTNGAIVVNQPSDDSTNFDVYLSTNNTGGLAGLFNASNKTTLNQLSTYPNIYNYSSLTLDPATVYVGLKDAYGNTSNVTLQTPLRPQNIKYYDISNTTVNLYREFITWDVTPPGQVGSGFKEYDVYRSPDGINFTMIGSVGTIGLNYYTDSILNSDGTGSDSGFRPANPTHYYYKVTTVDTNGNTSAYSSTIDDTPNGVGSTDTTPPTISNITISNVNTTSATVTWTT